MHAEPMFDIMIKFQMLLTKVMLNKGMEWKLQDQVCWKRYMTGAAMILPLFKQKRSYPY